MINEWPNSKKEVIPLSEKVQLGFEYLSLMYLVSKSCILTIYESSILLSQVFSLASQIVLLAVFCFLFHESEHEKTFNFSAADSWNKMQLLLKIRTLITFGHFRKLIWNLPTLSLFYRTILFYIWISLSLDQIIYHNWFWLGNCAFSLLVYLFLVVFPFLFFCHWLSVSINKGQIN